MLANGVWQSPPTIYINPLSFLRFLLFLLSLFYLLSTEKERERVSIFPTMFQLTLENIARDKFAYRSIHPKLCEGFVACKRIGIFPIPIFSLLQNEEKYFRV